MKIFLYTFVTLLFFQLSQASAQGSSRELLVESIVSKCSILFDNDAELCNQNLYPTLSDKFNAAEIYLQSQLIMMQLVDSSSYYEEQKSNLEKLESKIPSSKYDSLEQKTKLEKSYLLVSLLKPSKSYGLFKKLIFSYLDIDSAHFNGENSSSFFYYKIWLSELVNDRFKNESISFSHNIGVQYFNEIATLTRKPFESIASEKAFLMQLNNYANKCALMDSSTFSYDTLLFQIYLIRGNVTLRYYDQHRSDSLFNFTEDLYQKALFLNPEDKHINYALGAFYNNEAVLIINSINKGDPNIIDCWGPQGEEKRGVELLEKARAYLEKARPKK